MKIWILILLVLLPASLSACPNVGSYADLNCDGEISVVVLGDSLVSGVGDTKNGNSGGYVLRTERKLRSLNFTNLGRAGYQTRQLIDLLTDAFDRNEEDDARDALLMADVIVIDLGRNDRWLFGPPSKTYRNLVRARTKIKSEVRRAAGHTPYVVLSVLMLPNRGSQGPWVSELNEIIRAKHTVANPADLRFDLVSKRLLSSDQIHPTPSGYDAMAGVFVNYLKRTIPQRLERLKTSLQIPQ